MYHIERTSLQLKNGRVRSADLRQHFFTKSWKRQ